MTDKSSRTYFPATKSALQVLGLEVKDRRKSRGYSQDELARRSKCSRDTIRAIEAGSEKLEVGLFFDICARVGLILFGSPEELLLRRIRIQDAMKKSQASKNTNT